MGAASLGIGLASVVLIAVMALLIDGPNAVPQDTMFAAAGVTAALLCIPGAALMIFAPRVVIDLERGQVRDTDGSVTPLDDYAALFHTRGNRTVISNQEALTTTTHHLALLRMSDVPEVRSLVAALAAGDEPRAAQALRGAEWSTDAILVLEESSETRANSIARILRTAGVATIECLTDDGDTRILLADR